MSLTDTFIATLLGIAAIAAAACGIQAALRMRSEESAMRAEPVLATATARVPWALGHVVFAVIGPVVALFMIGAGLGLTYGADVGDMGQVPRLIGAALAQAPAAATLTGLDRRPVRAAAAPVGGGVGDPGDLPAAGTDRRTAPAQRGRSRPLAVHPHAHLPGGEATVLPLVVLTGVAAALVAAGLWGFRRRDVGV